MPSLVHKPHQSATKLHQLRKNAYDTAIRQGWGKSTRGGFQVRLADYLGDDRDLSIAKVALLIFAHPLPFDQRTDSNVRSSSIYMVEVVVTAYE